MKKKLAFIMVVAFILALFSGCGGNNSPADETSDVVETAAAETAAVTELPDDSPYNFAIGKVETNDKGYPKAAYEYELPISTTDEVLTYWTATLLPQYIPEDGYGSMDYPRGMNELTGVNIEYLMLSFATMAENFSALLAADDLPDMMNYAIAYYPGSYQEAVDDGYLVNLWDYKDYCPNFIYQATYDPMDTKTFETIFYKNDFIITFPTMWTENYSAVGKCIRGDYLEKVGLKNTDLVTWDDWLNALTLIKTDIGIEYPWPLTNSIDVAGVYWTSPSFDTLGSVSNAALPPIYIKDGQVCFGNITERDLAYMQKMNEFYNAGIIDPNWASYGNSFDFTDKTSTGQTVIMDMAESEPPTANPSGVDPNCDWVPLKKPLLKEGQVLHLGDAKARVSYGSTSISAKCENIPLAVTWCDFVYSPAGSFYASYGPEGILWEYDAGGNIVASEFAINFEMGPAWAYMIYALNSIVEHGLEDTTRKTKFDGGKEILDVRAFWNTYDYDGAYEWPIGCRLNDEETDLINSKATDIQTYISENISLFLDGSKPFSEWEQYVEGVFSLGIQELIDTYQVAYERYLSSK